MPKGITTEQLAELAGVEVGTIHVWVHRGVFMPEDRGKPRLWSLAETLAVVLFAATMRRNRTVEEASAEVAALMPSLVGLIRAMPPKADKLILVDATFVDERWRRVVCTGADLERLLQAVLRRQPEVIEVRDISNLYIAVLEAHHAERQKVPA